MIAMACNAEVTNNNRTWVIDNGTTKHMSNEQKAFTNLDKDKQSTMHTDAKHSTKSIGSGEGVLNARLSKDEKNPVKLKDTLFVTDLRNNLLSVEKITDNGYTITFKKYHAMMRLIGPTARSLLTGQNLMIFYIIKRNEQFL